MSFEAEIATFISKAEQAIATVGIEVRDLVQLDTVCYDVPTLSRYDQVKELLSQGSVLVDESEVNGRLIATYELADTAEVATFWPKYFELPQPKSGDEVEGVDHVQFVTRTGLTSFLEKYPHLDWVEKGNALNRLAQLAIGDVKIRVHDKSMGAVIELEKGHNGSN